MLTSVLGSRRPLLLHGGDLLFQEVFFASDVIINLVSVSSLRNDEVVGSSRRLVDNFNFLINSYGPCPAINCALSHLLPSCTFHSEHSWRLRRITHLQWFGFSVLFHDVRISSVIISDNTSLGVHLEGNGKLHVYCCHVIDLRLDLGVTASALNEASNELRQVLEFIELNLFQFLGDDPLGASR